MKTLNNFQIFFVYCYVMYTVMYTVIVYSFSLWWAVFLDSLLFSVTVVKSLETEVLILSFFKEVAFILWLCLFFLLYNFTFFWFSVTGINHVYSSVVGWIFSLTFFVWTFEIEVCCLCFVDCLIVLMFVLLLFVIFGVCVLCLRILLSLVVFQ